MDLKDFISNYLKFSRVPVTQMLNLCTSQEDFEFMYAFANDLECRNWFIKQQLKETGTDPGMFCCLEMGLWNIEDRKERKAKICAPNPERFVFYWDDFKAFGMQHSSRAYNIPIEFCPWCGTKLSQFDYFTTYEVPDEDKFALVLELPEGVELVYHDHMARFKGTAASIKKLADEIRKVSKLKNNQLAKLDLLRLKVCDTKSEFEFQWWVELPAKAWSIVASKFWDAADGQDENPFDFNDCGYADRLYYDIGVEITDLPHSWGMD